MKAFLCAGAAICATFQSVEAQYTYNVNESDPTTCTLIGYEGEPPLTGAVTLPSIVNGYTVTAIGDDAFGETGITSVVIPDTVTSIGQEAFVLCGGLASVTIPSGVTSIGENAFGATALTSVTIPANVGSLGPSAFNDCNSLSIVYFLGNAPTADGSVFEDYQRPSGYDPATVYYLRGATGFGTNFTGIPAVELVKLGPAGGAVVGVNNGQFSMFFLGQMNATVVLEACTNLAAPVWTPIQTNTLAPISFNFNEPLQTNGCGRYYRVAAP